MHRGESRWGPPLIAVLCGIAAALVVSAAGPALGATATSQPSAAGAVAPVVERYKIRVDAVAYHLPGKTALGIPVGRGVVAVDPDLIPLGARLFVPGYGRGVAADVGVAIKGRIIDVWMPNDAAARRWGRKTVTITVYR